MDVTGVILAGGGSTRLGEPKAFAEVGGVPVIERILANLRKAVDRVLVVTAEPADFLHLNVPLVADLFPGEGPAAGVHAGLFHALTPRIFVTACDMPFVLPEVIDAILGRDPSADVVLPRVGGSLEPLLACYSRRCLPHLEKLLVSEKRRIVEFFPRVKVREIPEEEMRRWDPELASLCNINTPEDLERARRLADQARE